MKNNNGITLIVLAIMIVIIIVLVGVSLSIIFSENSILDKANRVELLAKYSEYNEAVESILNSSDIYALGNSLSKYIPEIEKCDIEKFAIVSGKLYYIGEDDLEKKVAESLKIEYLDSNSIDDIFGD